MGEYPYSERRVPGSVQISWTNSWRTIRDVTFRFDSRTVLPGGAQQQPRFTLVLKHPGALRAMFSSPSELTLGEAYIYDDFDIQGDIEAAFDLADYLLTRERGPRESFDLSARFEKLFESDRPRQDLRPVEFCGKVHTRDREPAGDQLSL